MWRAKGVSHELEFWRRWFETRSYLWPDDYRRRLDVDAPLEEPLIVDRLPELDADPVAILDVGAGPLTFLGERRSGRSSARARSCSASSARRRSTSPTRATRSTTATTR